MKVKSFSQGLIVKMKMFLKCFVIISVIGLFHCYQPDEKNVKEKVDSIHEKIGQIKKGMGKPQVLEILGRPNWVGIETDRGDFGVKDQNTFFILYWRDPGFPVISVHFNHSETVRWDAMVGNQETYTHLFEPSQVYSCDNSDRSNFCQ